MLVSDIDVPDSAAQNTSSPISTRPCLECTARVYNINYGHNQELMARCRTLEEYSILIGRISSKVRTGIPLEQAADTAVQECIRDGILQDFLIKHRSEVVGMLLEEFDMDEYIKMERRDSYEDGHEDGLAMGLAEGLAEGKRLEQLHIIHTCSRKIFLHKAVLSCLTRTLHLSAKCILYVRLTLTGQMKIFTMH